ncbi:hypothetical protein DL764_007668 [Monosporascus ibericus]|uniref:Uncharacterized protein n=1 Tax=Monosporascus ibericus TaxID=155417 RepID=A0A4Q4SZG0_9PEZI|nr:hypothetical protein DL764_007668 [Monosporascus ibericus]
MRTRSSGLLPGLPVQPDPSVTVSPEVLPGLRQALGVPVIDDSQHLLDLPVVDTRLPPLPAHLEPQLLRERRGAELQREDEVSAISRASRHSQSTKWPTVRSDKLPADFQAPMPMHLERGFLTM